MFTSVAPYTARLVGKDAMLVNVVLDRAPFSIFIIGVCAVRGYKIDRRRRRVH